MVKRAREAAGCAVPMVMLRCAPTIAGLAGVPASMPHAAAAAIPRAPFTAAQKAAGVPCLSDLECMGREFLTAPEQVGRVAALAHQAATMPVPASSSRSHCTHACVSESPQCV